MHFIRIFFTLLTGLTLLSNSDAVIEGGLNNDEERSIGDGTSDDDFDLGQGMGDRHHEHVTNSTEDGGHAVKKNLELTGTHGAKPSKTYRNENGKVKKGLRKMDQLTPDVKSVSVDRTTTSKGDNNLKNGRDGDDKNKRKTHRESKLERGKKNKTKPKENLPEVRALPSPDTCPCKKWMPDWRFYSNTPIYNNGTVEASLCSKTEIPEITEIIAWLLYADGGVAGKTTVYPLTDCNAYFQGVKSGTYVIQANAYCPAFLIRKDGGELICNSGSKFSTDFSAVEQPAAQVDVINSDRLKEGSSDPTKLVLLGCGSGLGVMITLIALVCVIRKKIHCKRVLQFSHSSTSTSSSRCDVWLEVNRDPQSVGSGRLSSSWCTIFLPDDSSLQDNPREEKTSLQVLNKSSLSDGQSKAEMVTTTSFEEAPSNKESSGLTQNPSNGCTRDLTRQLPPRDSYCVPMTPGWPDLELNSSPGIVTVPKNDVIKGPFVPLHPSLFAINHTHKSKTVTAFEKFCQTGGKPVFCADEKNMKRSETKQLYSVQNDTLDGVEKEPLRATEKEPLCDTEKNPCVIHKKRLA